MHVCVRARAWGRRQNLSVILASHIHNDARDLKRKMNCKHLSQGCDRALIHSSRTWLIVGSLLESPRLIRRREIKAFFIAYNISHIAKYFLRVKEVCRCNLSRSPPTPLSSLSFQSRSACAFSDFHFITLILVHMIMEAGQHIELFNG